MDIKDIINTKSAIKCYSEKEYTFIGELIKSHGRRIPASWNAAKDTGTFYYGLQDVSKGINAYTDSNWYESNGHQIYEASLFIDSTNNTFSLY